MTGTTAHVEVLRIAVLFTPPFLNCRKIRSFFTEYFYLAKEKTGGVEYFYSNMLINTQVRAVFSKRFSTGNHFIK